MKIRGTSLVLLHRAKVPLIPVIVFLFLVLVNLKVLSSHQWNPRAFILARPQDVPFSRKWGVGYDGQFTYALATNPLGSVKDLDQPAYRYQRIFYPLLVRLLSLGNPSLVPWLMLLINMVAATLSSSALARLLANRRGSPWLALVFIFSLGYLLALRLDLTEPLTFCLALWGWLLYEEDRPVMAILFFALSGLTKEVGLLFPVALALSEMARKNWRRSLALALGSLTPYLFWYMILYYWFGTSQVQIEQSRLLLIPFWGLRYLKDPVSQVVVGLWVLLPAVISGAVALWDISNSWDSLSRHDIFLVLAQVALVATMPKPTWEDPLAVIRIGLGLLVALFLWLAGSHPRWLPYPAAIWAPSGLILFLVPRLM